MTYRQPFKGDWPISQKYGEKYTSGFHTGIDYACPVSTEIMASADGQVMFAGWDNTGYGLCVIIKHTADRSTLYAHLSKVHVTKGEQVKQSRVIGLSGTSGNSTGPHLHFEARHVWSDWTSHFDPMQLPLMSVDDSVKPAPAPKPEPEPEKPALKGADQLGPNVKIVAPSGAWAWNKNFTWRASAYPLGTLLTYTGKTTERNGLTYCEVYPEPVKYWVAVHDNDCQILDNA